ncbi:MAG: exo-alpha-sialidase [Firmicutes bacterium]|nr:exo-alpha-sialidase [Bacillota bacterium]
MLTAITKQFIMDPPKTPSCHASSVLPMPDGRVFCAWFGGSREGAADVGIYLAEKNGSAFDEPRLVASSEEPHWNPVLFRKKDEAVCLFFKNGFSIPDWKTYVTESTDQGRTWSITRELVPGDDSGGRGPVRNHPIILKSGRILAPASVERGRWRCFMDISDDGGLTWRRTGLIEARGYQAFDKEHGRGIIQPALWEDEYGVHALMRSGQGYIYRSDSVDDGRTWREAYPTQLVNNNSGIDLTRLEDGTLLLAHNPVSGNFASRTPLSLSASGDGGATRERLLDLETAEGEFSYPSIASEGNHIFLAYTWQRKNIVFREFEWR